MEWACLWRPSCWLRVRARTPAPTSRRARRAGRCGGEGVRSGRVGWAGGGGRGDLVTLLLARGADPIEPEAEPWATPLASAERRQHARIASILRQHGAT